MPTPSPSPVPPGSAGSPPDDQEAVLRFVEQFALSLQDAGMPRMAARVFAFALADDAEIYTAGELADGLRVSPAAISVAARYLVHTGMLGRERLPGSRSDHYRVYDADVWSAIVMQRLPMLERYEDFLAEGVKLLDPNRPGGRRVQETLEFFRFIRADMPRVLERWSEYRRKHRLGVEHDTAGEGSANAENTGRTSGDPGSR